MSCWSGWLTRPGTLTHGIPELHCAVLIHRQGWYLHSAVTKGEPNGSWGPGVHRAAFCLLLLILPCQRQNWLRVSLEISFLPQSQRALCNAVLFYSPMAGSPRTAETAFAAGTILPHKMKYPKPIYILIPNIRNDSPGKSFDFRITCAQTSKTPFLAS